MMNAAEIIKKAVPLSRFFADEGIPVKGNGKRAVATWRGGERDSVSIDDEKRVWCDHATNKGGGIIEAWQKIHGGTAEEAIKALAERYNLEAVTSPKRARKTSAKARSELVASYDYTDERGVYLYSVDRYKVTYADGSTDKDFRQRCGNVKKLGNVRRVLYKLPEVLAASRVFIVEGEKDVETLRARGITATTNSGGADYWRDDFNEAFSSRDVVIIADNDAKGQEHGLKVAGQLVGIAKSVKLLTVSRLPKGDVTDWIEREGGSIDALEKLVAEAPEFMPGQADAGPITNYTLERVPGKDGKEQEVPRPKKLVDICKEITGRFGGFPKKLGSTLFYFDKGSDHEILELPTPDDLSAWVQRLGKCNLDFLRKTGFPTWREVFANLEQTAERFDAVAKAPFWPERKISRTFALYGKLPEATPGSGAFWKLLDFMSPASDEDRLLMAAFFIAPIFFSETGTFTRPAWGIDTDDGQGAGKSTVPLICSWLYDCDPIGLDLASLEFRAHEAKKRIISAEGRARRIVLFDNVTQTIKSATLFDWITAPSFSERQAYGRGENTRPNDLTFVATFNGGKFDTDGAVRFYVVKVRKPERYIYKWKDKVFSYIHANRPQIFADIIALLEAAQRRIDSGDIWTRKQGRFPEFDANVLGAVCKSRAEFDALDRFMTGAMSEANDDAERAEAVETAVLNAMQRCKGWDPSMPSVFFASDIDVLLNTNQALARLRISSRDLRGWIRSGLLPRWSKDFRKLDGERDRDGWRAASFLFGIDLFDEATTTDVQVVKADWGRRDGEISGEIAGYTKLRRRCR